MSLWRIERPGQFGFGLALGLDLPSAARAPPPLRSGVGDSVEGNSDREITPRLGLPRWPHLTSGRRMEGIRQSIGGLNWMLREAA